jgi:hypothetical protein
MSELLCNVGFSPSGQCTPSSNMGQLSKGAGLLPRQEPLTLLALNHISRTTEDVGLSTAFYRDTLGFSECRRPQALDFEASWYALTIQHLVLMFRTDEAIVQ